MAALILIRCVILPPSIWETVGKRPNFTLRRREKCLLWDLSRASDPFIVFAMQIGFSFPLILRSPFVSRVIGINDEFAEKLLRPQPRWNVISPIRLSPQKLTWPSKEKTLPLKPIYYAGMTQRKCNDISSKDTASSFSHCLDGPSK